MTKRLVVLAQALLVAAVVALPGTADEPPGGGEIGLCGLTQPTDQLLRCGAGSASAQSGSSSEPAATGDQPPAAPPASPPVQGVPPTPRFVADLLLVKFRPGKSLRRQQQVLAQAGVSVERRVGAIGLVVVRMAPAHRAAALASLEASPRVASAEKDAVVDALQTIPNDTDWPDQWGLRRIELPAAWDTTRGSRSVIVAVLDTGVDRTHPDLAGAVLPGFDLVNGDSDPADDQGHGTAVAGVIAARTNNREGMAGVCWSCSILPIKVLGADGSGDMALVAAGIVRAVDAGAHVINLSLGGPADDQALQDAVSYAVRNGTIVVAAAGNNGTNTPFYPAAESGAIAVAATDPGDRLYPWSNHGPWTTVAAPGCNLATVRGGGYGTFCGTSSATPMVSGLVGLALSARPGATRDQVIASLEQATTPVGGEVAHGRVDAAGALGALPAAAPTPSAPMQTATATYRGEVGPGRRGPTGRWSPPARSPRRSPSPGSAR